MLFRFAGESYAAEPLKIASYDARLNGSYVICNGNIVKKDVMHTGGAKESIFPVLRLGAFSAYQLNPVPPEKPVSCGELLQLYKPEDISRHSCLPPLAAAYLEERFFSARRFPAVCWYINLPHMSESQERLKTLNFKSESDPSTFIIIPVTGLPGDMLALDLSVKATANLTVAQILLLQQLFYDFLIKRLASGAFQVESPLQFLSNPSVPVFMPDFLLSGNHLSTVKLLKSWNKIESSFLKNLSMDYIKEVQEKLSKRMELYAAEPRPRLTLMMKLLVKYGYLHSVNDLQKEIARADRSVFLKTAAGIFRHSRYTCFWLTAGSPLSGIIPAKYMVKMANVKKQIK